MARRFTRNITDTVLKGDKKEPLNTNVQNDILSDGEDVAIRNKNEYHILTDNIKEVTSSDLTITKTGKNSINISGTGETSSVVFPYLSIHFTENTLKGLVYWYEKVPRETIFLIIETNKKEIEIELQDTGEENYFDFTRQIDSDFSQSLKEVNFQVFLKYRVQETTKNIGNFTIASEAEAPTPENNFNVVSGNNAITVTREEDTFTISGKEIGVTSGNPLIEVTEAEGVFTVKGKEVVLSSSNDSVLIERVSPNEFDLKAVYPDQPDNPTLKLNSTQDKIVEVVKNRENDFTLLPKETLIQSDNFRILGISSPLPNDFILEPKEVTVTSGNDVATVTGSHEDGFTISVKKTEVTSNNQNTLTVSSPEENKFLLNVKQPHITSTTPSLLSVMTVGESNKFELQPKEVEISSKDDSLLTIEGSHSNGFDIGVKETVVTSNNNNTLEVSKNGKNEYVLNAKQPNIYTMDDTTLSVFTDSGSNDIYLEVKKQGDAYVPNPFSKYDISVFWNYERNGSNVTTLKVHIFGIRETLSGKGVSLGIPMKGDAMHETFTPAFNYFASNYVNEFSINLGTDGGKYNFVSNIPVLPISIKVTGTQEVLHLYGLRATAI